MTVLEKIELLMEKKNLNKRKFSIDAEIPYNTIRNFWIQGADNMHLPTFRKICDYFGVTMDSMAWDHLDIEYRTDSPAAASGNPIPDYDSLNRKGRDKVKEYAADLAKNDDYKKEAPGSENPGGENAGSSSTSLLTA